MPIKKSSYGLCSHVYSHGIIRNCGYFRREYKRRGNQNPAIAQTAILQHLGAFGKFHKKTTSHFAFGVAAQAIMAFM